MTEAVAEDAAVDAATAAPDPAAPLIAAAKRFAALSGLFVPADALAGALAEADDAVAGAVASALAEACDTNADASDRWLLRSNERRNVIGDLIAAGTVTEAVAERRRGPNVDADTEDLLATLTGEPPFDAATIAAQIADDATPRAAINRLVTALGRALPMAGAEALIADARAALQRRDCAARRPEAIDVPPEGTSDPLGDWLAIAPPAVAARAAFIAGEPGTERAARFENTIGRALAALSSAQSPAVVARLDFARPGLDVADVLGLTMELARQVGDGLGSAAQPIVAARLAAASVTRGADHYGAGMWGALPEDLVQLGADALAQAARPLLVALDSLEAVRDRCTVHPALLFEWLDRLLAMGSKVPIRVIAAGRADALDGCRERIAVRLGDAATALTSAPAADLADTLMLLIEREDWVAGLDVVAAHARDLARDPTGHAADAARALYWRGGRWSAARRSLAARDAALTGDADLATLSPPLAQVRIEMRAESSPVAFSKWLAVPGVADLLATLDASAPPLFREGAVGFMRAAALGTTSALAKPRSPALAAALTLWTGDGGDETNAVAAAYGTVRDRWAARNLVPANALDEWNPAQLLAALSPYPVPAAILAIQRDRRGLAPAARRVDGLLSAAAALLGATGSHFDPVPGNPVAGIAGLGLFAEWAGAQAFLTADADLALIAAAAEAWRRTVVGDWRYGRRPRDDVRPDPGERGGKRLRDWRPPMVIDPILCHRIDNLSEAGPAAARAQLAIWEPDGDAAALIARIERAFGDAIGRARTIPATDPRFAVLQRARMPSAFLAPMTVLTEPRNWETRNAK